MKGPRYCSVEIKTACPRCGGGVPLNGPLPKERCSHCQSDVNLPPDFWKGILSTPDDDYGEGGADVTINFKTTVRWRPDTPRCTECGTRLPHEHIDVGTDSDFKCSGCGAAITTFPAPAWLHRVLPSAVQVYGAERERRLDAAGQGPLASSAGDGRPVVLSCPQCHGSLSITTDSTRTVSCEYCSASVYIPDDLWQSLHPAKTVSPWHVRYEGPSNREREEEAAAKEEAALKRGLHIQELRNRARLKSSHIVWAFLGALIATVAVSPMLVMLLEMTGPPELLGDVICPRACSDPAATCRGPLVIEGFTTTSGGTSSTEYDFFCTSVSVDGTAGVRVSDGMFLAYLAVMVGPLFLLITLAFVFTRLIINRARYKKAVAP